MAMAVDVCAGVSHLGRVSTTDMNPKYILSWSLMKTGDPLLDQLCSGGLAAIYPGRSGTGGLHFGSGKTSCASMSVLLYWHRRSGAKYHPLSLRNDGAIVCCQYRLFNRVNDTLRGSSPDYCPYTTSSYTTQVTGDYVGVDEFRSWIAVYSIPVND